MMLQTWCFETLRKEKNCTIQNEVLKGEYSDLAGVEALAMILHLTLAQALREHFEIDHFQ